MINSNIDTIKMISKAFNSSCNIEQLIINLDLAGMTLEEAEEAYSEANKEFLKHMKQWCVDGKVKFARVMDEILDSRIKYVLPWYFAKELNGYASYLVMKAINSNGEEVATKSNYDLIEDMIAWHKIDLISEIIVIMMRDLAIRLLPIP